MLHKENLPKIILYVLLAVLLLILCSQFTYFVDDWHWGMDSRLSIFLDSFSNEENTLHYHNNGRYLGNALGFLCANHKLVRDLIMMAALWIIIVYTARIGHLIVDKDAPLFSADQIFMVFVCAAITLFTPKEIFRESVAWCSAFMNYVVPAALFLLCLYKLFKQQAEDKFDASFFLLPLISSLFMENLTIGNFLFILSLFIYRMIRKIKPSRNEWLYFLGTAIGLIIMFSDDGYRDIFSGDPDGSYWGAQTDSFSQMIHSGVTAFISFISVGTVRSTVVLTGFGAISCFSAVLLANDQSGRKLKKILIVFSILDILIAAYFLLRKLAPSWNAAYGYTGIIDASASLVFLLSFPLFGFLLPYHERQKEIIIFTWLFAACVTIPLFVAKPLSMRVFFPVDMFLLTLYSEIAFDNLQKIRQKYHFNIIRNLFPCVFVIFSLAWCYLFSIYAVISHYEHERIKYVRYQESLGNYETVFPKLPYEDYVIISYPWGETWQERYRKFYGLNTDMRFNIISFEEWKDLL